MCAADELAERTVRKVSLRLLPFLFLLYVVAFLDRVNFGYAALEMNSSLGLSAEVFGFLSGIFFIGYLIFEIPSNIILQRIGARIWISRIIISWGVVVIITAAATDAFQLAALRFILGVAEAGFFPGVILYITCWFRRQELARAVALFMTALAVSNYFWRPPFHVDPRQYPLVWHRRLAVALYSRRPAGNRAGCHYLVLPDRPAKGRHVA